MLPITTSYTLLPSEYIADNISPILLSYNINIGLQLLILTFTEPIRASSVQPTLITLYNTYNITTNTTMYTLTGSTNIISNKNNIIITMNTYDISNLKLLGSIGILNYSTYMTYSEQTFADFAGNPVVPVSIASPLSVSIIYPDTIGPSLLKFDLNFNIYTIILTFSEPINIHTIQPTAITLQSRYYTLIGTYYTLTGGTIISYTLYTVSIRLNSVDIYNIEVTPDLCRNQITSYLTATSHLAFDLLGRSRV